MGAGSFSAGSTLAGEDAVPALSPARNVKPPAALLFDGATRDFPLDATGLYRSSHPVDQKVALAICIMQTVGSAPTVGNKLRSIKRITKTTPDTVRDMVNRVLRDMVAAGDIRVVKLEIETRPAPTGAILVALSYQNLRTVPPTASNVTFPVSS